MNKWMLAVSSTALSLSLISGAGAESGAGLSKLYEANASGPPESVVYDAASAMAYLRTWKGNWKSTPVGDTTAQAQQSQKRKEFYNGEIPKGESGGVSLIAGGSVVRQSYVKGSLYEMEVLYNMDGPDKLILSHYCSARNVPVQKFTKTGKPGEIKFEFAGGMNLNPATDPHFHATTIQIVDKDTYRTTTTLYGDGKPVVSEAIWTRLPDEDKQAKAQ